MVDNGILLATGLIYKNEKFFLNLDAKQVNNPHLLFIGESGSGKTTLMLKAIMEMYLKGKTIFLIDFHGDMRIDGENYIKYTPRNSPFGVNPFEIEKDEDCGGVNIQAEVITVMLNQYFMDNKLGKKQINILKQLIIDTYKINGIVDENISTWSNEIPRMEDLGNLVKYIKKILSTGIPCNKRLLEESIENIKKYLPKELAKEAKESIQKIEKTIDDIEIDENKNKFEEIDINYYLSSSVKRVFEGLYVYLEDIVKMTIFNGEKPKIIKGINRLDFSAFTQVNKPLIAKFLAEFTAQKLFRASMLRGQYSELTNVPEGSKFDRVLVFDESKLALPHGIEKSNPYNIMNRFVTESRKYGIALFLASQRVEHYSDEILSNIFTKIILKVKANNYKSIAKLLGVKEDFIADTFNRADGRPAIIETNGNKHSYLIENF